MKWMRERDLLIAQTMAFVQSVTGKPPEAVQTRTASAAVPTIGTTESTAAAAPIPDVASPLAQEMPVAAVPVPALRETPPETSRPAAPPRPDLRGDFQSEIKARVANFRAHQERFNREREAYCAETMAKVHAVLRESYPPPRPPAK
jgi:hypothetical protein